MGEPVPGDIPDPIRIQSAVVKLKAGQSGVRGDFLIYAGQELWEKVPTTPAGFVTAPFMQTPEDFTSVGASDGEVTISAYGPGTRIYAVGTRDGILPNGRVRLEAFDNRVGFTNQTTTANTGISITNNVLTVTTTAAANIAVGDIVTVAGLTQSTALHINGQYKVASRTATAWTAALIAANQSGITPTGTTGVQITAETTSAQYIKKSGNTYGTSLAKGEIGVFDMNVGGNAT